MTRWPAYPAYKDSGIAWLGEIPAHWETVGLKYVMRLEYGDSLPSDTREEGSVPVFGSNGPVGTHIASNTLEPTIIVGRKGSYGKVNYSDAPVFAIDTTYYVDSRTAKANLRWLFYVLQLLQLDSFSEDSAIPGLSRDFVYQKRLPDISLPEQRAIAAFLGRETDKLDALTCTCERLLDVLEERRAALISHAVTKGLDPDVAMKDSGIPWLGEIPAHWNVRQLKYIALVGYSNVDKHKKAEEQAVRLCNYVDVYYNDYITNDLDMMQATASPDEIEKFSLKKGDIVVTKDSETWDDIAVPAYVASDLDGVLCGYHLALIHPNEWDIDSEYLFHSFLARGISHQFRRAATGITRYGLGKHWLENALFLVPPLPEQRAIAAHLDRETAKLDALAAKVRAAIERLVEYRTALISAAITGKIDVRAVGCTCT